MPDAADLQEALRAAGLEKDRPVLVVHAGASETDFGAAARVYWTLKTAGFPQLAVLNGGYEGWVADEVNSSYTWRASYDTTTFEITGRGASGP